MYGLTTTAEPATEPVSLTDAKTHLRVDHDAEDVLLGYWIAAARRLTERHTNQRWITQTVRLTLEGWPTRCDEDERQGDPWLSRRPLLFATADYPVRLPVAPVQAIDSVTYYDQNGVSRTLSSSLYQTWLDHSPPLLAPAPLQVWPQLQDGRLAPVAITLAVGFGDDPNTIPPEVIPAMLLTLGYWFEHRGDSEDPTKLGLPLAAERLLNLISTGSYV